jgi:diacylglycerol kinase family enzyme
VLKRFGLFSAIKKHAHLENPAVHYVQSAKAAYQFDTEVPAHLDGELIFATAFDVDVLPGGLRSIIDPAGAHYFRL